MIKVNKIGNECIHVFVDANKNTIVEVKPEADYYHIHDAPPGTPRNIPTREGCVWTHSFINYKYDTPDGELHNGEYAFVTESGGERALYVEKGKFGNISKEEFVIKKSLIETE